MINCTVAEKMHVIFARIACTTGLEKNLNSSLSFWVSSSLLLLAWGHFLIIIHVVNDFVRGRLTWTLSYWVRISYPVRKSTVLVPDYWTGLFSSPAPPDPREM